MGKNWAVLSRAAPSRSIERTSRAGLGGIPPPLMPDVRQPGSQG
jgi:hypothetical protein